MGWTYEVTKFVKVNGNYEDVFAYRGESLLKGHPCNVASTERKCLCFFCLERLK